MNLEEYNQAIAEAGQLMTFEFEDDSPVGRRFNFLVDQIEAFENEYDNRIHEEMMKDQARDMWRE